MLRIPFGLRSRVEKVSESRLADVLVVNLPLRVLVTAAKESNQAFLRFTPNHAIRQNFPKMRLMKRFSLIIFLLSLQSAWALNPHPRIWLTPGLLSVLNTKKVANDPDWLALKARADLYKTYTVPAYDRSACSSKQLCYTYEGSGWYDAMLTLALAYQITGDASYAAQAKAVLVAANAPYKNSGDLTPITLDSGYPTRFVLPVLAIGYDWLYDYLDTTTKTDTINTINAAYTWFSGGSPPYAYNGPAYNNYFGGHMLGFGLAADATDGDDANSNAIYTSIRANFDLNMGYALQSLPVTIFNFSGGYYTTGGFLGGGVPESYNYGPNHNIRLLELLLAWRTSGRVDLTATYGMWLQNSVENLLYTLRPNLWQVGDDGDMPGNCTGVLNSTYPLLLAYWLNGTTEGAWSEYLFRNLSVNPCDGTTDPPALYDAVLWKNSSRSATSYATEPTNYMSMGDGHLMARSDWGASAVFFSFNGSGAHFTDHENLAAGNIEVQRGSDYLLVDAAQWKGIAGYGGNPSIFATAEQYASTLFFDDGGAYNYTSGNYVGGQMFWGVTSLLASRTDPDTSYVLADLGTAYDRRPDSRVPASRTARYYYRSVAYLGGNAIFVWDRFRANSSTYTKRLQWHLNPTNPPSVNGAVISTTKGSSSLFIDTVLSASPTIVTARDIATSDGTAPLTYNMQVSDSVSGTDLNALTVIYATSSGGSLPSTTSLGTIDANHVGVQVSDSTPLVVIFAKTVQDNGNNTYTPLTYISATFMTTHSGTGKYLVTGLQSGNYSVRQGGVALPGYSSVNVGADGTLFFNATSGSFSIVPSVSTISPCDLNADGTVDSADVQIAIRQALGTSPCTNDLDQNGVCNVIDVQRMINAANGHSCKVGP